MQKITTFIPTYRRPELLKRALSSVLSQTYPFFEVCVCDNASGDATAEIVQEFSAKDTRVKYHCHPENIGMIANYAFALSQVQTPYFSLLSDDDVLFPWFFEEALQGFQKFPDIAFSATSTLILSQKGEVIRIPLDLWEKEGYYFPQDTLRQIVSRYPVPTGLLFHKKVADGALIDQTNPLTWDCDFLIQIAARYPLWISKRPCAIFLHHDDSYSYAQNFEKWHYSHHCLIKRLDRLESLSLELRQLLLNQLKEDLKACHRAFVFQSLLNKNIQTARADADQFFKDYGWNFSSILLWVMSRFCTLFPTGIYLLFLMRKIKRKRKQKQFHAYHQYAKYLHSNRMISSTYPGRIQ